MVCKCVRIKAWVALSLLLAPMMVVALPTEETRAGKQWTLMIYMAGDNSLADATTTNLNQLLAVGSNSLLNIVVQVDTKDASNTKVTRRYYVEKNNLKLMNADDPTSQAMDSGDPNSLISFCTWAITNYSANNYALILWNHGSGVLDPRKRSFIDVLNLFSPFDAERGVCWDDTTGHYLSNQKLATALNAIVTNVLHKKLDIIGFDACLMGMYEVASVVKNYANIMVASQETESFEGWDYQSIVQALATNVYDAKTLATLMVTSYKTLYQSTQDFTMAATDLTNLATLETAINDLSSYFIQCIRSQKNGSFKNAVKSALRGTTHFYVTSYVDLYHFCVNMTARVPSITFTSPSLNKTFKNTLLAQLRKVCAVVGQVVIANGVGRQYSNAHGLSIYLPTGGIDLSYKTYFASTQWLQFLTSCNL